MIRFLQILISISLSIPTLAVAQAKSDLSQLTYPELEVTPSASERLEIEAKKERTSRWTNHWPLQLSALATLTAASKANAPADASSNKKTRLTDATNQAHVIGGAWLGMTIALAAFYNPYRQGYFETSKMPVSNTREKLTRERLAEESLYAPAELAWKLAWFSVATELYASVPFILNGDSDTKTMGIISAFAAFTPLIFEYRWSSVARQHREYKKKIYGPTAGPVLMPDERGHIKMGYGLAFNF